MKRLTARDYASIWLQGVPYVTSGAAVGCITLSMSWRVIVFILACHMVVAVATCAILDLLFARRQ